jgi:hypothetical protein
MRFPTNAFPGDTYKYLTVLSEVAPSFGVNNRPRRRVLCRCKCGVEKEFFVGNMLRGLTTSCGCRRKEVSTNLNASHRMSRTRTYKIWVGILVRTQGKSKHHQGYFSDGITLCKRWFKFENFLKDMGEAPENLTIERVDNEKGYSLKNCVWADRKVQARNRRNTVFVNYQGKRHKLMDLMDELGGNPKVFYSSRSKGFSDDEALRRCITNAISKFPIQ